MSIFLELHGNGTDLQFERPKLILNVKWIRRILRRGRRWFFWFLSNLMVDVVDLKARIGAVIGTILVQNSVLYFSALG